VHESQNGSRGARLDPHRLVLVACDASEASGRVRAALEQADIPVIFPDTPAATPARARTRQPSFIVLSGECADAGTPDGSRVLEVLKSDPYTAAIPVLVTLPQQCGEAAELEMFRRGADACVSIPASEALLRARLSAIAQCFLAPDRVGEPLNINGISLNLQARKVNVNGDSIPLTRKEFDLLNMLLRRRDTVVYTTHLYHAVWGFGAASPVDAHTVKVHVSSLRRKLGPELGRRIVNLPGLGYRYDC
jgi:DNA-binding response OmpR family regulator